MDNLFALFASAAERFPAQPAVEVFRTTGLETYTYEDIRALTERMSRLLASLGCGAGARIAILADNDARWCSTYLGILRLGAAAVPLDTAYKHGQVRTVLEDSGARLLVTTPAYLDTARQATADLEPAPTIVLMSGATPGIPSADTFTSDTDVLPPCPAGPSDPAVILYTSGTTSDPKGVVLTHGNLLAERTAALEIIRIGERDRILGILPLFHALAQVANLLIPFTTGARVVFLTTINSTEMMRALSEREITAFCVVPQFFYFLHQRVTERVAARGWLARTAFGVMMRANGTLRERLGMNAGRLFFGAVHQALGGRMRILVTGGSRFEPRIGRDLYRMGLNIVQAYGLTECTGGATLTRPGDACIESVGQPLSGVEVRILEEATESGRDHRDGEVLIKGPIVMAGYHNRPDATAAALRDGWLYTGDLGYLDRRGRLHITGRKKEIIVLASGKNIYPEEIEAVYAQSPYISEVCVLGVARPGDPSSERLHAIVVPNFELMRERGIVNTREIVRFDMEGLSLQLPHHKRVLSFDIWREPLPRTTTRKLKRHQIERLYREQVTTASEAARQPAPVSEEDRAWASDPHVEQALRIIREAAREGAHVTREASLELDLGLDSMERVELLTRLEQAFGTVVSPTVAQGIYTVRELVEALRAAGAASGGPSPSTVDPWRQLLEDIPDDPDFGSIIHPKTLFTPFAFAISRMVYGVAWLLLGFRVSGREHLQHSGPYLISPNHQGYLDGFLLMSSVPYGVFRRLFFVGASEYFMTPTTAFLARLMNIVPVDPDVNLVRAMQAGAYGLRHGKILVLFPEGERSPDGTPRTFKKGAAILSSQLGVPIVPVAINGVYDVWPRGRPFRWRALLPWAGTRVRLRFGTPVDPGVAGADERGYAALTDVLRNQVVEMWTALDEQR
ncbi:MAG TPA: AMP-binding protein [Vicinamibacterales bacterium]